MNNNIISNEIETAYPVIVQPTNFNFVPNQVQPMTGAKTIIPKKSKSKIILIISLIIVGLIIIAIITITVVVLNKSLKNSNTLECEYGFQSEKCIECGIRYFGENKIVGGETAISNSWPSIVLLVFSYKYFYKSKWHSTTFLCGGTLINRDTVLTAAHCYITYIEHTDGFYIEVSTNEYYPTFESMYSIFLGVNDIRSLENGVKKMVRSFIIHPNYDQDMNLNDIAVIKLESKVNLNEKIQIACIPRNSEKFPNKIDINGYIAGWGNTVSSGDSYPDLLQEAIIKIYNSSMCSSVLNYYSKDWNNQICAGNFEGGVDTCQGDSGGPLFVKDLVDNKQKFVLAGVTSYGDGCALRSKPGIYTRVSSYLDWIKKNME